MIILKLRGGLGNQLFQYAIGISLATKLKTQLKLDCFDYGPRKYLARERMRSYDLKHFSVNGSIASFPELIWYRLQGEKIKRIREKEFTYDPSIINSPNNCYLDGFWQCERYFRNERELILKEFAFVTPPSPINQKLLKEINATPESVCLHVRRGDYVTDKVTIDVIGACSLDYYYAAIEKISQKINKPKFYIFSDDPGWVKENLKIKFPTKYVDNNSGKTAYEDLRLMSNCKHFIIANSTFSWWGAWLSSNKGKIVIAPKKWFNDPTKDSRDLVPSTWLRL